MKVLYILSSTTTTGGGSKALLNMLYGVMQYGVQPVVVCPDKKRLYSIFQQRNIPVYTCFFRFCVYPPFDKVRKNRLLFVPRLFGRVMANIIGTLQVCRICRREKPDIIHTNVSVVDIGYHASRLLHIPHIWHIREYGALDFNYYYYYYRGQQLRRYRQRNSYTICITKDIQRYNKLENINNSRIIYDGVLSEKSIYYTSNKRPYFFFAGRIEPAKGVLYLLQAYVSYCNKCAQPLPLYLAGRFSIVNPNYVQECQKIVKDNNLQDKVIFLGEIQDVLSHYQEAQALIVPSLSEGFGFITTEAMFSGCLVVGNDVAGTKEQFDNGKQITGEEIALRYTTQEQLVQYLIDITNSVHDGTFTAKYEPMILRGQQVVMRLYTSEQHAKQVFQFYQDICSNNF